VLEQVLAAAAAAAFRSGYKVCAMAEVAEREGGAVEDGG